MTTAPAPRRKHSKGTPHRGVRISDDLWDRVKAETTRQGINVSDLIRGLLRDWLNTKQGENSREDPVLTDRA